MLCCAARVGGGTEKTTTYLGALTSKLGEIGRKACVVVVELAASSAAGAGGSALMWLSLL